MVTIKCDKRLVFVSTILWCLQAVAATISTPASTGAQVLWSAFEWHAKLHNGEIASSWEQLSSQVNSVALQQTLRASPNERFTFYGETGPIHSEKGQIVLVTNNTIIEDRRETPGRYIVWHKVGKFRVEWIGEPVASELFAKSGKTLPSGGVWEQPNTKHASDMMGIKEPLNLDAEGNVISDKSKTEKPPGVEQSKGRVESPPVKQTSGPPLETISETETIGVASNSNAWLWLVGGISLMLATWLLLKLRSRR